MKYSQIRKLNYKIRRKNFSYLKKWYSSPYSFIKAIIYIELASALVYFVQNTFITPNIISLLYVILTVIGAIMLSSGVEEMIILGVIIFFLKAVFDWSDGILARIQKQKSYVGYLLDPWGGLIGSYSILIGLGFYLYNFTQEIYFLYVMIFIITIRAIDIKDYAYHYLMYDFFVNNKFYKNKKNKKSKKKEKKISTRLLYIKSFFQNLLDNRSRTYDFIGLFIIIELSYDKIILTNYIYYLFLLKFIILFLGGLYLIYYKNYVEKIISKLSS